MTICQCHQCGQPFAPYSSRNRFCCRACDDAWFAEERREGVKLRRQQRQLQEQPTEERAS
jgi:hypothetical protein